MLTPVAEEELPESSSHSIKAGRGGWLTSTTLKIDIETPSRCCMEGASICRGGKAASAGVNGPWIFQSLSWQMPKISS